ncbi:Antitoxin DinJ [Cedecea neteri]|uniref:Antitoxin DinJ n=1 Tax=Cedecea neteri TaxID=158822 RepID=A0A291E1N8_9ENTR|nr:type II toxin-antitoxin system RelB/DinJ family antitoxin [Cedecea neteri]ATF93852.1 type II toxin-antitoxin system RelB/DinJ family antitoxin [Cedecea neteri]SQA97000.1 Antitoxin DinJ [Cedecea neteri]
MSINAVVRARIDPAIRDEATEVLAQFGMTISDVMRMTLAYVAKERALPFEMRLNATTIETIEKAEAGIEVHRASDAKDLFDQLGM